MRPRLPERIGRLYELADNMWWSWHIEARSLFRTLDHPLWRSAGHNPVKQLLEISVEKLEAAAKDPAFLDRYDQVMADFDADLGATQCWLTTEHPELATETVAYFSAEFAIHNSLPIYAGGLGVLSGDLLKEASDLGHSLVGVGFMYPQGYFVQRISPEGWQEELYQQLNFDEAPVSHVLSPQGDRVIAKVKLENRTVFISVWLVNVGRVRLYLLDTNLEGNTSADRELSARLYIADREQRIQQEIVLGIGGVRVLRTLGIQPVVWHANEGHTAFMALERVREEVEKGASFADAVKRVQSTTVFTTHTPVPAGHDVFPVDLVDKFFREFWGQLTIDRGTFLGLGQYAGSDGQIFNMTALALKMTERRNAVSELHGKVARRMWQSLWPNVKEDEVPLTHVTNGIHIPTWIAPELYHPYAKHMGEDMLRNCDDPAIWEQILDMPDEELWSIRQSLKRKLIHVILEHAQEKWAKGEATAQQVLAIGALLDQDTLTIGFVRRFTEYKRPALIFRDIPRLKRIVNDKWRPVQIIFAGKSHPADFPSKHILHQVFSLATDREFQGRIALVEDYDMHLARYLAQGVDVWLNCPRRLQEACGTSGMKASINGVLHLSVRDGWWYEAYNGKNGWAIGDVTVRPEEEDQHDAESLYSLLEQQIVPLFYERDRAGVPHGWVQMVKEAIRSVSPRFCGKRMLKDYTERMYLPALKDARALPALPGKAPGS